MTRPAARPVRATAATAVLVAALAATLVLTVRKDGYFADPAGLSWLYAACWVLFAAAVWSLRRAPARHAATLVLAGGLAVALTGLVAPPRTSTDSYRYAWDGRVQAAGISPYDHAPADTALLPYRDTWLFPTGTACDEPDISAVSEDVCTRINRPRVHTIYPPAGELYFLLVHALSPDGARHKALQAGGAALAVATTLALLRILRRRGDPRTAAYWAWCPAVPVEAVNNAHADALAVLLSVLALGLTVRHRARGGAILGLAVATKLLPAVLLPGALSGVRRTRDAAATLLPAAAVLTALYLPYVLLSHSSVLGYLAGYADEEGYQDPSTGNRYALLRLLLPDSWSVPAVLAGMLAVSLHVIRRGDPERPWSGALLVAGTAFLLTTPGYSWYALLLIALVALDGRWEWLGVALAGAAAYLTGRAVPGAGTAVYAAAALAVICGWALRRRTRGRPGTPDRTAGPDTLSQAGKTR
ncbi:glycosyltransferase 87 family protein [Streptomyces bambusae]|uniref:glycosyltransferase 87 family protein n=1 Tax=Streptomyces bambusae TaxID=1550616 RepID=UPI001CFF9851|nr:glycosyltransferase 87 family protein [Streptomyces bambusae]MCB5170359.1 glycosyltransferase 87 family protein [Streptomyces bambusae]